jgi:hypothetical protein
MLADWRGQPVSATDPATVAGIDDFVQGFLAYEPRAAAILTAAETEPDCGLANAYAAMFWMFLESREAPAKARPFLDRARAAAPRATGRERMVVEAVGAWVEDDIPRALAVSEALAEAHPRELATAKAAQYHHFNLGDAPGMLRIADKVLDANAELAWAHGLHAFACEQAHRLDEAEAAARRAIAIRRREPWAHHALAHVFLTQGRTAEARAFLDDVKDEWSGLNSFMSTHNWWHMALVMIDQGEGDRVPALFDAHVWGVLPDYSQDQIGAVSLLARLELVGVDVGDRWAQVAPWLAPRVDDHVQPFLSMQYLYGLARAGAPEADATMDAIRERARTAPAFVRPAWAEVAVPACEGLLAHARGDAETCVRRLGPVLHRLVEIGGSHAQRDLFDQIHLDALIGSGRLVAAQRLLEQRREASPEAAPVRDRLAAVYRALGLPREAALAQAAAKRAQGRA